MTPDEVAECAVLYEENARLESALTRILTVLDVEEEEADDLETAVEAIVAVIGIASNALGREP